MRSSRTFIVFALLLVSSTIPSIQGQASSELHVKLSSPFSNALETLQKQIGYTFEETGLLRRAMTHASFSEEKNKALSILGGSIIETSVSFQLLSKDIDVSAKELNRRISQVSNVESSCSVDGVRLGLHKVVRVSPKTNASAPSVVCGAFRAIFGAIALDTGNTDDAGSVFLIVHGGELGVSLAYVSPSVMRLYTEATDGSYIETKESALVWHYYDADPDFGSWQAKQLLDHLESVLANEPVVVKKGKHIIEVKSQGITKGLVTEEVLSTMTRNGKSPDFVMCIGDDRSDEDMFESLLTKAYSETSSPAPEIFACTVGQKPSKARYYLDDTVDVMRLLKALGAISWKKEGYFENVV